MRPSNWWPAPARPVRRASGPNAVHRGGGDRQGRRRRTRSPGGGRGNAGPRLPGRTQGKGAGRGHLGGGGGAGPCGRAWVYHLEVHPRARRQGVAALLMREAVEAARERVASLLGLNVFGDNAGAIALYEALGYTVTAQQMILPLAER
ncbi:MAG TPA: GNAT family N-acetyltransferase [Blastococcus sp.]